MVVFLVVIELQYSTVKRETENDKTQLTSARKAVEAHTCTIDTIGSLAGRE